MIGLEVKPVAVNELVAGLKALGEGWREAGQNIARDGVEMLKARTEANIAAGTKHGTLAGKLREHIEGTDASEMVLGRVTHELPNFKYVELGRPPGTGPSVDDLAPWVLRTISGDERTLRSFAYLVMQKIKRRGVKAKLFMARAMASLKGAIGAMAGRRIDEALAKGRR